VVRQGQLISPFGIGSTIDIGQESFVMADISRWPVDGVRRVLDSHLETKLKRPIKTPLASEDMETVAIHRFPRWHFCPRCRVMRMVTGADDAGNNYAVPTCANLKCRAELTPMGFVAACKHGHLSEVDWHWWAHSASGAEKGKCSRQGARMWFETTGQGGGDWSAITVRCSCGARRNFAGLVQVESPMGMHCRGGQPWQSKQADCGQPLWVYRRAASNLHFPRTISALDLLPTDSFDASALGLEAVWEGHQVWSIFKTLAAAGQPVANILTMAGQYAEQLAMQYGCTVRATLEALERALYPPTAVDEASEEDTDIVDAQADILRAEWATLSSTQDVSAKFLVIKRTALPDSWPVELLRTIKSMSMVKRLREVRAFLGFRRLSPEDSSPIVPADLGAHPAGWYPGVEAWGEGIFIQLDSTMVNEWEGRISGSVSRRLKALEASASNFGWPASVATPRFLLLHSLSHAISRRLSFDAGYSASSIRERIYAGGPGSTMCGILLYTADGDSEGSLGGLVRMGEPSRFGPLLQAALLDVAWCSADPVCKESDHQGFQGMNAASCHACMLTSETSCAFNNCLLDRRTLVGLGEIEPFFMLEKLAELES